MECSKEMLQKISHILWNTNLVNFPLMNSLVYEFDDKNQRIEEGKK